MLENTGHSWSSLPSEDLINLRLWKIIALEGKFLVISSILASNSTEQSWDYVSLTKYVQSSYTFKCCSQGNSIYHSLWILIFLHNKEKVHHLRQHVLRFWWNPCLSLCNLTIPFSFFQRREELWENPLHCTYMTMKTSIYLSGMDFLLLLGHIKVLNLQLEHISIYQHDTLCSNYSVWSYNGCHQWSLESTSVPPLLHRGWFSLSEGSSAVWKVLGFPVWHLAAIR